MYNGIDPGLYETYLVRMQEGQECLVVKIAHLLDTLHWLEHQAYPRVHTGNHARRCCCYIVGRIMCHKDHAATGPGHRRGSFAWRLPIRELISNRARAIGNATFGQHGNTDARTSATTSGIIGRASFDMVAQESDLIGIAILRETYEVNLPVAEVSQCG